MEVRTMLCVSHKPSCISVENYYASRRSQTRDTVKLTVCVCVCVCPSVPAVTAQRLQYDEN